MSLSGMSKLHDVLANETFNQCQVTSIDTGTDLQVAAPMGHHSPRVR